MGTVGDTNFLSAVQHLVELPNMTGEVILERYLARKWVPELRTILGNHGVLQVENNSPHMPGMILFATKNEICVVDSRFGVTSVAEKWHAIGSGEQFALGSLDSTTGSPQERVMLALKAAAKRDIRTQKPFDIKSISA